MSASELLSIMKLADEADVRARAGLRMLGYGEFDQARILFEQAARFAAERHLHGLDAVARRVP